jgi:hypothetical protein
LLTVGLAGYDGGKTGSQKRWISASSRPATTFRAFKRRRQRCIIRC